MLLSFGQRTFLFSFVPMCLALAATFLGVNAAIKRQLKAEMKHSLLGTEAALDRAGSSYRQRTSRFISTLSENAALKAAMGLVHEVHGSPAERRQAEATVEAELSELGAAIDYDRLIVSDAHGKLVAAVSPKGSFRLRPEALPSLTLGFSLLELEGSLLEATTVPINLGSENLGSLTVARSLDLSAWSRVGYAVLVRDRSVLLSTAPAWLRMDIERELRTRCVPPDHDCEISIRGESYLAVPVGRAELPPNYALLALRSIDALTAPATLGLRRIFLLIAICGVTLVLAVSIAASRSIVRPLTELTSRLRQAEVTGLLPADVPANFPAVELNLLAHSFNRAAQAARDLQDRLDESLNFVKTMARALDARDAYTAGHSDRVSAYAARVARAMGLDEERVEIIRVGAQLHDIGKIGIPDAVLQKPGRLTAEEYDTIKLHPQIGRRILDGVSSFQPYLPIVELHHENYDGTGYPYGWKEDRIPLEALIVHVVDVYDAMTSARSYRVALAPERVLAGLKKGAGTMFDPRTVEALLAVLAEDGILSTEETLCYA